MRFDRSLNLIGEEAFARFRKSSVAVFGIGGVGGFVAEALAAAGSSTWLSSTKIL